MTDDKLDLLKGTLDLLILKTLSSMGPMHGYGIARRLEQISGDQLAMNEGTVYTSLARLHHRRKIGGFRHRGCRHCGPDKQTNLHAAHGSSDRGSDRL